MNEYPLSPEECSCGCPDFKKRRSRYDKHDPRRICKHLVRYWANQSVLPDHLLPHLSQILHCEMREWGFPLFRRWEEKNFNGERYSVYWPAEDFGWVIFSSEISSWAYSPYELRWSFAHLPAYAEEMAMYARGVSKVEPHEIVTQSRKQGKNKWHWHINAYCSGVRIFTTLNARARWQTVKIDGVTVYCHPIDYEMRHRGDMEHLKSAIIAWLEEERRIAREAIGASDRG